MIDFGDLEITEESSTDVTVTVTNYGNIKLDLELYGYASYHEDEQAMNCEQNNISVNYEHFDLISGLTYSLMTSLNG